MISTPKNIQILDAKKKTLKTIFGVELDDSYLNYLGLDRIFVWSCDVVKGAGSDGTPCKGKQGAFMTDKAFGLIDMTFLSPLFL